MAPAKRSSTPLNVTPFTRALETRVLRHARRTAVFRPGERVLVAVSGGQDSACLLLVLARRLADEFGLQPAVAHFDHRLRTRPEAREDVAMVRRLASALGLPLVTGAADVRARARRRRESIEEAARHLRLAFLRREARRIGATAIALGHTRDDRAETVLLHLLRGSGLDGLVGLRPRSRWPLAGRGPDLTRPLLDVSRGDTLRYCRQAGIEPREDPTNQLLDAARNRVRLEALPALRRFNPRLDEALCRLGDASSAAVERLDSEAEQAWRALAQSERHSVTFPRRQLAQQPPALRARLLRRAVRRLAGVTADVEAVHVAALEESLTKSRSAIALPFGLRAEITARKVVVRRGPATPTARIEETPLAVPGRTEVRGWTVAAEIVDPPPSNPRPRSRLHAWLDAAAVDGALTVRSRKPGDRLRPLGLRGEKKVQDLLVDARVPREDRDAVPVVCGPWGVAWVVGHRLDERAALREGTRSAIHLRFLRRPPSR